LQGVFYFISAPQESFFLQSQKSMWKCSVVFSYWSKVQHMSLHRTRKFWMGLKVSVSKAVTSLARF